MNETHFRLLATEALDPSGSIPNWIVPGVRRLGWRAWTLPTREAVGVLGVPLYTEFLLRVVDELRPHVLLVHPPYDFLSDPASIAIRKLGTRILGLGHDDARFFESWNEKDHTDLASRFDLWATTSLSGPTVAAGALRLPWVLTPESMTIDDPHAPGFDVVLLGRHTQKREELACAIAGNGARIACFGPGWAQPALTRPSRLGVMRRSRLLLLPEDPATPLFMMEAGLLGTPFLVQNVPGLDLYGRPGSLPTYETHGECLDKILSGSPPSWTDMPAWEGEWPKWSGRLHLENLPERNESPTLSLLHATLFHAFCAQGKPAPIPNCLAAWSDAAPESPAPLMASARLAFSAGEWQRCRELCMDATPLLVPLVPKAARSQSAFLPATVPLQGACGIDPTLEIQAMRLQSTVRMGELGTALDEIGLLPAKRRTALLSVMVPHFDHPDITTLMQALSEPTADTMPPGKPENP